MTDVPVLNKLNSEDQHVLVVKLFYRYCMVLRSFMTSRQWLNGYVYQESGLMKIYKVWQVSGSKIQVPLLSIELTPSAYYNLSSVQK